MHLLKCAIPIEAPTGIVTRPADGGRCIGVRAQQQQQQTLVTTGAGQLIPLLGADALNGMDIGSPLEILGAPDREPDCQLTVPTMSCALDFLRAPVWDAFSDSLFAISGNSIVRLGSENLSDVTTVAGHFQEAGCVDGPGASARFNEPAHLVTDGLGSLYVADVDRIRRVQLPAAWRAAQPYPPAAAATIPATITATMAAATATTSTAAGPFLCLTPIGSPSRDEASDCEPEALVSTLPLNLFCGISGLAYSADSSSTRRNIPGSSRNGGGGGGGDCTAGSGGGPGTAATAGSLIFATAAAVYRVLLRRLTADGGGHDSGGGGATAPGKSLGVRIAASAATAPAALSTALVVAAAAAAVPPAAATLTAELLAGREDDERGPGDGPGDEARFLCITGLTLDGDGSVYVVDYAVGDDACAVRRVAADGSAVTTLAVGLRNRLVRPAVLPNGYLALCDQWSDGLQLLGLGLTAAAAAAVPGSLPYHVRSLAADLGALLDRQPDGTADLIIAVNGRTFAVHRGILAARCDYFRRRLTDGGLAEGAGRAVAAAAVPRSPPLPPSPQARSPLPQSPSPQQQQPQAFRASPQRPPLHPWPPSSSSLQQQQQQQQRSPPPQPSPKRHLSPQHSPSPQHSRSPQLLSPPLAPPSQSSPPHHQQPHPQQHQPQLLTLPDADPNAFAVLLRFLYTGELPVQQLPAEVAPALADLADRLALPALRDQAQALVLAAVRPETVVGALLWAEARGPAFAGLLAALKDWYLAHHAEVVEAAPGSVKRLMVERCELMMELHFNYQPSGNGSNGLGTSSSGNSNNNNNLNKRLRGR